MSLGVGKTEVGSTIEDVRWMTDDEMEREGWSINGSRRGVVLEMMGGGKIFASQDDEGNGPGAFFGESAEGRGVRIMPIEPAR